MSQPFVPDLSSVDTGTAPTAAVSKPAVVGTVSAATLTAAIRTILLAGSEPGLPVSQLIDIIVQFATLTPLTLTTISGGNGLAYVNGSRSAAKWGYVQGCFLLPAGSGELYGGLSDYGSSADRFLLGTDHTHNAIRIVNLRTLEVSLFCGTASYGLTDEFRTRADIAGPMGLCLVPSTGDIAFTEAESGRIRLIRARDGVTSFIAGCESNERLVGPKDGVGTDARFGELGGIICSSDSKFLVVGDISGHRLRSIDLATRQVNSPLVAGSRSGGRNSLSPKSVGWDRTDGVKPDSVVYFTSESNLWRFDLASDSLDRIHCHPSMSSPNHVMFVRPHYLLVSTQDSIWSFDTRPSATSTGTRVAGNGESKTYKDGAALRAQFGWACGLSALEPGVGATDDRIWIADSWCYGIRLLSGSILAILADLHDPNSD